ncbi:proline-rich protein 12 isoform X2 [Dunckerocampus dactyliophorus]|uniref:proline-rich protein 12 isoform X2 n=1 Tax=Dunckerocampus dactyliophorus TaxID=161453 RepID=UPI002404EE49|nr:proline-rich protein 12 isoform X2 [Dunckerocampus dactyliophorus]
MERNYPAAAGFGDLGSGTGWSYDRSAKASLMYGSARLSHPDSELLHRQAYGTSHPLQGYATNHHPGSSRHGGSWGAPTLGLSGLFDASLHHSGPSGPDPSVMNLISALDSRGPQPPPSASSLLTQFRTPSWQTGAIPGSSSFPSSSALSAYQHPGSFSGRSFTPSLSLQDTSTFSPSSNGLLSPHDPLLHIKPPSQSSLGFDRLLSSQSAAYRSSQELPAPPQNHAPSTSSSCHLPPPQFNLLSSQLHNQSSQLYNASMFSSKPALIPTTPPQPLPPHDRAGPRQDSVIKHYQRSSQAQSTAAPIQQYIRCGGSVGYQQIPSQHRHAGVSCSPLGEQSPPSDPKPSQQSESQTYQPIIQTSYTSSSSSLASTSSGSKETKSSTSGYSSSNSASSSSRAPHTPPPLASSTSSSSSSNPKVRSDSLCAPSRQQPPPPPAPPPLPVVSSTQPTSKTCLSTYSSPPTAKSSTGLQGQNPQQQQGQSYSPNQPATTHMTQSYGAFSSPNTHDMSSGAARNGGKAFTELSSDGRSFSAEIVFGDSNFSSTSLRRTDSPSLGYGSNAGSTGSGASGVATFDTGLGSAGSGSGVASVGSGGSSSYHLNESSPSPTNNSAITHPGLHSPASARPAQSPGGSGASKYLPPMLSPNFMASSQGFTEPQQAQNQQSYHSTPPKPKTQTNILGVERSQEEEEEDDFLIQQLLHTQSSTSHSARNHPPPQQIPQQLALTGDTDTKGLTYDINKISEERFHLHSVIRTNSTTSVSGPGASITDGTSSLNSQLEISQTKQQHTNSELKISKPTSEGAERVADSVSLSHTMQCQQSEHDSLGSVGHYGRGDPFVQHPHSHPIPHVSPHSQQRQQSHLSQHTQPAHRSQQNHSHQPHPHHMEPSDRPDSSYMCNTPDAQQARQNQVSHPMMNSPPNCPQQTHMLQSAMSHNSQTKMEPQRAPQQHPLSQHGIMESARGAVPTGVDSQSSQLQLQLQNQSLDTRYSLVAPTDQSQLRQNSVSPLGMLDQSLSQPRNSDSGGSLDRTSIRTGAITGGDAIVGERHRQQLSLSSHHHRQPTAPELQSFLSEPDLGLPTTSHMNHLNQSQTHAHHQQQAHSQHQLSHSQLTHPQSHRMPGNMGTPQQQSQPRETENHLSHTHRLKPHQFDTVSPGGEPRQNQSQQQEQFTSLTSICFSDSLLNDEDRSFFPGMEDMFCSANYKSSCAGVSVAGQPAQDSVTQARAQDGMDILKTGGAGERYGMVGHHGDQGYGQYCHNLSGTASANLHLDLDSMKTHQLPSTVNTDQLGLIQSQTSTMGLNSAVQGGDSVNKMTGSVGVGGGNNTGMTSAIFCSSRPKKLLKTSSFYLLKQRREPQPMTKKNYVQEYEFEDDEDKADAPADIRLNSRRLPDLLPDLVSSCRKAGGSSAVSGLSPLMGDMDFCHPSSYSSIGHSQPLLHQDGPKKRGRKPTKPKREGPPRPRGRPRIRPLPEPPYCRGLTGAGESRRGRGRGRGRGKREEGLTEMHHAMNKAPNLYQQHPQQHFNQPQLLQQQPHEHHRQLIDHHHISQQQQENLLHHHVTSSHHQLHHQQQQPNYQHLHQPAQQLQHDPDSPIKITLPGSAMPPSQSLLRTDSLSSTDHVLSDGSVGSAPSLGPSPGPSTNMDMSRNELNQTPDKMHHENPGEITWKKEMEDQLNPEGWGTMQKLCSSVDEKAFDFKPGFMSCFLDFLKTGKKQSGLELGDDGCEQEAANPCSSQKGGIRPITPTPPLPQTPPQGTFSEERGSEGADLALGSCPSPCKPLDEELKGNLEVLPSFSSDEEDSVSKNQDLQKSISSAISALYDTPHSLAAAMASAMVKVPSTLSPPTPQEPPLSPLPPLACSTTMPNGEEGTLVYNRTPEEKNFVPSRTKAEGDEESESDPPGEQNEEEEVGGGETAHDKETRREPQDSQQGALEEQEVKEEDGMSERQRLEASKTEGAPSSPARAPAPLSASPSISPSPPTYSSPSPHPPACPCVPSPHPIPEDDEVDPPYPPSEQHHVSYQQAPTAGTSPPPSTSPPAIPSSPLSNLPQTHSIPPPSTTPPPSCSDQDQDQDQDQEPEAGQASPSSPSSASPSSSSSPPTPEEAPASQRLTALHLAKKQADAAIAGESEEEDSESGGEGIFRERDEFVVRTEDIGTLKMALQTGREPPPIWRVQKALLQKFSPEIKDGQRQFCATSNYLGYFGDAKMRYQRLYVKFLENVNKKDYVRVCSRKPWHRTGLTLRRQSLPKQLPATHNQTPPRLDRDERDRERQKEQKEQEKEQGERVQREKVERERKDKVEREKKEKQDREQRERDRRVKEIAEKEQKERRDREQKERERKDRDKTALLKRDNERREKERREEKDRDMGKYEKEQKERDGQESECKKKEEQEKEKQEREKTEKEKQGREWKDRQQRDREQCDRDQEKERRSETGVTERERHKENQKEVRRDSGAKEVLEAKGGPLQCVKEEERTVEKKMARQSRSKTSKDKTEPPPKKRKKWLKEVPSSSSDSDSSYPSEDEGPLRVGVNNRAMREMFRSYVEMLVSTALDPDMIQALEDTDDELYLPPMRKIDSMLSEQKKRLLRRINMSSQHQEALHVFPKMTADPLESGTVKVRLGGEGYNRKTLNHGKRSIPKQQDLKISIETCRIYSLYHSLHHYKYHTFLHCKKETDSIEQAADDPGQEEVVQQCMANQSWLESLFSSFMEMLSLSAKA